MRWHSYLAKKPKVFLVGLLVLFLSSCGQTQAPAMVSTANVHASKAALEILQAGGSAVDAAIAAQLVLGLVEPQSSGIGGGAFMLHWAEKDRKVDAYDGRERAPALATESLFLTPEGKKMAFKDAVVGGRSVGVPGVIALLARAYKDHGKLPWPRLFRSAIQLAEDGFEVSPRLNALIKRNPLLRTQKNARNYFYVKAADGKSERQPLPVGYLLKNPAYAQTLKLIAKGGEDAFYKGPIAKAIVATVNAHPNKGLLSDSDLEQYRSKKRKSLCRPYRTFNVCGMPPPTSGGIAILQILRLLEPFRLDRLRPNSTMAAHLISEASKLAFADRNFYVGDSDYVDVPVEGLLSKPYLLKRATLISPARAMPKASAGVPAKTLAANQISSPDQSLPSTSHLAIVDSFGNAVSMTTSVEGAFGSHLMVKGFMLNNQLTDFSFVPDAGDRKVVNRVAGGKRPRSSMSPTIILDKNGEFYAAIGSPGGSSIIGYVARTIIALIDWKLPMQDAIALPHVINRNGVTDLEQATVLEKIAPGLEKLGHKIRIRPLTSGLHGIAKISPGILEGGADPRREGVVMGYKNR